MTKIYWTKEIIVDCLLSIIKDIGELRGLENAITKNGGMFYFRKKLGYPNIVSPKFWTLDNYIAEIKKEYAGLIAEIFVPNYSLLKRTKFCIPSSRFGVRALAETLNCKVLNRLVTRDGHIVDSIYELILDEYLYSRQIKHEPHVKILNDLRYKCDQKLNGYFVEVWGYCDKDETLYQDVKNIKSYYERKRNKEKIYKDNKFKLISLEPSIFNNKSLASIANCLDGVFKKYFFDISEKLPLDNSIFKQSNGVI